MAQELSDREKLLVSWVNEGHTYVKIGKLLGLSGPRVQQLVEAMRERGHDVPSPIEVRRARRAEFAAANAITPQDEQEELALDFLDAKLRALRIAAGKSGILCTLTARDLWPLPKTCPMLGIPLFAHPAHRMDESPAIRAISSFNGYTKDNVVVISTLADRMLREFEPEAIIKMAKALAKDYPYNFVL